MPELCAPALHSLLPDVLSSLSKVFDLVECEMATCPNVSEPPHSLPVTSLGQQIYVVPEKCKLTDVSSYMDGGKVVATLEGHHIISDGKTNYTLRIGVQDSIGDWRNCIAECMNQKYGDKWEFLCLEQVAERSNLHLLRLGKEYVTKKRRVIALGPDEERETCIVWLIPVTKVIDVEAEPEKTNGVTNGTLNGTPNGETSGETTPKKIVKKKIIKKVVKKKDPNAPPSEKSPEKSATTSENGEDKPKKTLVSTKTEKSEDGTAKVVKKKIVDKSTPKENSPEVVQEVVEDITNAAYIVKLGMVPAPDGKSLADEKDEPYRVQNGPSDTKDASESPKSILDTAKKFDSIVKNGLSDNKDSESTGLDSPTLNGNPKELNGMESPKKSSEFSYGRVSATKSTLTNGGSANLPNGHADTNDEEKPKERSTFRAHRTESTDKSEISTLSEATSTHSQESKYESPMSPTIRLDPLSSDDDYSSVRSGSLTRKHDTIDTDNTRTSVLSGFLSSLSSGLGFTRRSPSPTTSTSSSNSNYDTSTSTLTSRLRTTGLPPISESNSRSSISGLSNGFSTTRDTRFDRFDRSMTSLPNPLTLVHSNSSIRANPLGRSSSIARSGSTARFSPPKEERMVQGMPQMPVVVLQQVLKQFTYHELNKLRRVHPHWDELCGQMLNGGYYELIDRASIMMMDCQRRVPREPRLQRPLKVLTNLQVHVLNAVDILRAPMDEGVVCFPYGKILDQSFALLEILEKVIRAEPGFEDPDMIDLSWEHLSDWARRAVLHYRRYVEPEVEKRLNEAQKLSAVQRQLQRLDSFLVETNIHKLEKMTDKTRDELHWEIEQLKSQNTQLRKDNRELKQNQQKLEARVEALERKFKTVARLLS